MGKRHFIFLDSLKGFAADGIAAIHHIPAADRTAIDTMADLVAAIGKQAHFDEVVIFTHGYSGGIMLEDQAYTLSDPSVKKAFAGTKTTIDVIRFEGCWIGEAPVDMAAFGALFHAKSVSGFTWTCNTATVTVTIPRGYAADKLNTFLADFVPWMMPESPTVPVLSSMARNSDAKATLPLMWYRADLQDDAAAAPYVNDNFKRLGRQTYGARKEARNRSVTAAKAVNVTDPRSPFEYVTVTL